MSLISSDHFYMNNIDQSLLSYSHEVDKEREDLVDDLSYIDSGMIDNINDSTQEDQNSSANEKVQQILSDCHICMSLTGFLPKDIEKLVTISSSAFNLSRKGRRIVATTLDMVVMLLQYLRCYPRFERGAFLFNLKPSTYENYIKTALEALYRLYEEEFIINPARHSDLPKIPDFKNASYVVDATVQVIYMPVGPFTASKLYFSGKHYFYCLKSQVICDGLGAALHISTSYPGSKHDMAIFKETYEKFKTEIISVHPKQGTKILADKGYISQEYEGILLTPFKGDPMYLTRDQNKYNKKLSSARVIVEQFFGRMKNKFCMIREEFRGNREDYYKYFIICAALTNFDIRECNNPLHEEDSLFYQRLIANQVYFYKEKYERHLELRRQQRERRLGKYTS